MNGLLSWEEATALRSPSHLPPTASSPTPQRRSSHASTGFTNEERAAIRERAREQKASADKTEGEADALAKIAELPAPDRAMAQRLHALITASVPALSLKTWYGMPAYANQDGKIVCFFQPASKFKTRYATLGFNDSAHLDAAGSGGLWPVAFALTEVTAAEEAQIAALIKQAVSRALSAAG